MSLNKIIVMGRITKDIELRRTTSGTSVTNFTVAVDRDFDKDTTDFLDVVCWRNTAEFAAKYFGKGRMAVVSGSLQMRDWTDKDGNKRESAEIVADNIYFADSKKAADSGYTENTGGYPAYEQSRYPGADSGYTEIEDDGDLPF
jgi:single-strand DNA-binding protein